MEALRGKKILVGITGGIAVYKAASLVRRLTHDYACDVQVVMTEHALEFMTPLTFETFTDKPVLTSMWASGGKVSTRHIDLVAAADMLLIVPATANIVGKTASGIGDDLLSTMILAADPEKCFFALAMNTRMYENPFFQQNRKALLDEGYGIIEPEDGPLASRTEGEGKGRLADEKTILSEINDYFSFRGMLKGKKVLISGGPTREYLDDIRFISNPSTGKMGIALARAAAMAGADVTLVLGPGSAETEGPYTKIRVNSADEMAHELLSRYENKHIVIMAAAVEDIRPEKLEGKVKKQAIPPHITLSATTDILREMGKRKTDQILVGFSVELQDEEAASLRKLKNKNLDFIVINNPLHKGAAFGHDTNACIVLGKDGLRIEIPLMSKRKLAEKILSLIAG
ncbi:bifunctional phosphopantothenoylcysteine decarboxylase/phosphopantothenate--cysteine ligase CoaBC [Fidelibacter multiformis]|jgi:phosphopantothenoylcysteine decarboxylase/phosphopantothenate--cysteine ligase|uniref:bifunctional phosphopantothenoylcysteine decarboxylase/phosphopantothenate--cysteine ligase CoaBC n=1 Tax=Fidelibacter multiformis TaxID=3377529 RepID=UPI0037DC124D